MTNIQFGSNDNLLRGWINFRNESECNITKPLPFGNDSVDRILIEHVLEHVTPLQGFRFLKEARRVLTVGGVIRVIVPDVQKIWQFAEADYFEFVDKQMDDWWAAANMGSPTHPADGKTAVETIIGCHGHKSAYNAELLYAFIAAAGLDVIPAQYGQSMFPELNDVDNHWRYMGLERCKLESACAEGVKR